MTETLSNNRALELLTKELKAARLGKKLSVDDVSQMTRIQKHYLENLEAGNFSFLPTGYVYACIKAYMREMGLNDSEDALEQCKEELKKLELLKRKGVIETGSIAKGKNQEEEINVSHSQHLKSILPLTIGMFIGVLGGIGFSYMSNDTGVVVTQRPALTARPSVGMGDTIIKKQRIDSSAVKHKGKNQSRLQTPSIPAKLSPALADTSVSFFVPPPLPLSSSQK
jgi:cytoskeletal protein RodZ